MAASTSLAAFIATIRQQCKLLLSNKQQPLRVVIGNEACDLDSAACSLTLAHGLSLSSGYTNLPLLNISRQDYALKTEVVFALEQLGITQHQLLFRDDVDLFAEADRLELTLVDFNALRGSEQQLAARVVRVIDHHVIESQYSSSADVDIQPVGSCSTLVAKRLLSLGNGELCQQSAKLLLASILLDTVNLLPAAGKATDLDKQLVQQLMQHCSLSTAADQTQLYESVQAAKKNVSSLTSHQLLRRDLKEVHRFALASLPMLAASYLQRSDALEAVLDFCQQRGCYCLLLLGTHAADCASDGQDFRRDLAVCSGSDASVTQRLTQQLADSPLLQLQAAATSDTAASAGIRLFQQLNITASRKQILPAVLRFASDNQLQ